MKMCVGLSMAVSGDSGVTEVWEALGVASCSTSSVDKEAGFDHGEDIPLDDVLSSVVAMVSEHRDDILAFGVCSFAPRTGAAGGS